MMTEDEARKLAEVEARDKHSRSACHRCLGFGEVAYFGQMVACECRNTVVDREKRIAIEDRAFLIAALRAAEAREARLREALEQAAKDLDDAAEDAGRSYYADRAQAAREAATGKEAGA